MDNENVADCLALVLLLVGIVCAITGNSLASLSFTAIAYVLSRG